MNHKCPGNVDSFQFAFWCQHSSNPSYRQLAQPQDHREMSIPQNRSVNDINLFISGWGFWTIWLNVICSVPVSLQFRNPLLHSCIRKKVLRKYLYHVLIDFLWCLTSLLRILYHCTGLRFVHFYIFSHLHFSIDLTNPEIETENWISFSSLKKKVVLCYHNKNIQLLSFSSRWGLEFFERLGYLYLILSAWIYYYLSTSVYYR